MLPSPTKFESIRTRRYVMWSNKDHLIAPLEYFFLHPRLEIAGLLNDINVLNDIVFDPEFDAMYVKVVEGRNKCWNHYFFISKRTSVFSQNLLLSRGKSQFSAIILRKHYFCLFNTPFSNDEFECDFSYLVNVFKGGGSEKWQNLRNMRTFCHV
jgi:hypothetical protein